MAMIGPHGEPVVGSGAPLIWRVAAGLTTAAAVALLALVAVHWGWRWFGPTLEPAAIPAPSPPFAPVIVATPLFGRAAAPAGTQAAPDQPAASTFPGDTRLLGVFAQRDGGGYALFRLGNRGAVLVAAGGEIADDVTLSAVHADGVRIRDHGVERELRLRAAMPADASAVVGAPPRVRAAPGAVGAACGAPSGYRGPVYRLNAELLAGIASQPEGWTAVLAPTDGGLAVRDQSGFAALLGMKAGDRMAQANGIALAGVDDVLVAVVKPLVANQAVHVVGRRDGKPAEWLFVNAGACP